MSLVFRAPMYEARSGESSQRLRETGCHFDRAYSIMFGNKSEYEYCLWSFARELASGAEKSSLYRKDRFLDYARNDGIKSYLFGCNAKPPPQPTHGIRQAFGLPTRNDGIKFYLFGCNAKPPPQPTHGIRQAFGLPTRNDGIKSYLFGCNAKPPPQPTHGIRQAFGLLRSK